jgi:cytochrome c553
MRTVAAILLICPALYAATSDNSEFFEMRVRPLLANNCYGCHTGTHMGGLQLDTREHVLKGGNSGPAIVPGDPAHSVLIQAVQYTHPRFKMPPTGKLKDTDIADLTAWIKAGADWGTSGPAATSTYTITSEQRAFWSFQPVRRSAVPPVKDKRWIQSPIDKFILARLEAKGLRPARTADKRTLIRRATYDLIGLPPTPEEVDAFVSDRSPEAFAKVVDRLLASPRYGERWGRYWLDVARYSDDKLAPERDEPYPNAFRYRDWVIAAFNNDMPYDQFVRAQIAGDAVPSKDRTQTEPGLGFYALSPEFQDDRVDATTRGFLGLTVACAQCHDHKYDPIPSKDYYSLHGVFASTELSEYPLAGDDAVKSWQAQKKKIDDQKKAIEDFIKAQSAQVADVLASKTAAYIRTASGQKEATVLDDETLDRWKKYLERRDKEHPFLNDWRKQGPEKIQTLVLGVSAEMKEIEDKNHITLGANPNRSDLSQANLVSLERDKYVFWNDLFGDRGILRYSGAKIDRFLSPLFKQHLDSMRAELDKLQKALPPQYPFLQVIRDKAHPADERVQIRGSRDNLGEVAPRRFLQILCVGDPAHFTNGSGRLELADAIARGENPLTARVMANRVWQHHFGQGIVRTPSNFGQLGDRPSHPELLDYLASELMDNGWSIKKLHREIMLSSAYQLSADYIPRNASEDPDNRLIWRANRHRLDVEAMRDSILAAGGDLDLTPGGPPAKLIDGNHRRTVYGFVSRRRLDGTLALFDFPNPNNTSEQRIDTNVPVQRLFFMNSDFVQQQAKLFAARLKSGDAASRIMEAYRLMFGRKPAEAELKLGLEFVKPGGDRWEKYAQVLLSSNEFNFVE